MNNSPESGAYLHVHLTALDLSLTASGIAHPDGRADASVAAGVGEVA